MTTQRGLAPNAADRDVIMVVNSLVRDGIGLAQRVDALSIGFADLTAPILVTLTSGATSTTVNDSRITADSYVSLVPLTESARSLDVAPRISARSAGSITFAHGALVAADINYVGLIVG